MPARHRHADPAVSGATPSWCAPVDGNEAERLALLEEHRAAVRLNSPRCGSTSRSSNGRSRSTRRHSMDRRKLGSQGLEVSAAGPRLHGHDLGLRRGRRAVGPGDDPPRARARRDVPRHRRDLRPAHERASSSAARSPAAATSSRSRPSSASCSTPRTRRRAASTAAPENVRRAVRGVAAAARDRPHRPLLPAPRRPERADRGDGRRDGRAGRRPARSATSACPRPRRRRSAARTPCIR